MVCLSASSAFEVLVRAGELVGIDVSGAELIRDGSNVLYRLPGEMVARVGPAGSLDRAAKEVRVSHWLAACGVPAVTAAGFRQPVEIGSRPVTFWSELPPHRPATAGELGAVLRKLHALPAPNDITLPALKPFDGMAERIDDAAFLPPEDREFLRHRLAQLKEQWRHLPPGLPPCVVHGDAWQGNVAVCDRQQPLLLDLEHVSWGRPEWDLVPLAVDVTRFDRIPECEYQALVSAYGYDVTHWAGFDNLADISELRWTLFVTSKSDRNPAARREAEHRLRCLRGHVPRPWSWSPF
ncbi:aminoglycoside phosphotransferase [Longimycelium tulufanense]|uniref:Aminoglycoside phosphotransferase n=1 Tax=Longimycelium tulufanense TaxID=907463 RepID=A0A8J3FWJ3_9PSEU|nr:aminoglycoside phosphotransferase family protein [Longimycelium tulufanense]GGM72409.1 aminoglycoside phosphotransferase [Longimycelium tulufanense]